MEVIETEAKAGDVSPWRFSVAPMMDWTDRHCRFFHRTLTRHATLYTEMVTANAVIHGDRARLLGFSKEEHPLVVQLGGSDPALLAEAARICECFGYDEINLNVGCPSDRVQGGHFGACLMAVPELVGACVAAMRAAVRIPVSVKCRIGIDDQDPETALFSLARHVVDAGVSGLTVHARKAWLQGLSPKENREVPPLDYGIVYRLKTAYPELPVAINGGILTLEQASAQLANVDGVMLGRAAYQDPAILIGVDPAFYGATAPVADGFEAVRAMLPYVEAHVAEGGRLHAITRHMLGLFNGLPGARAWRRHLATEGIREGAGTFTLLAAMEHVARGIDRQAQRDAA
jgi:tRNA-dihydrouridine synthase A